eukprot:3355200-Rhodomonas_salina.1
MGLHIVDELRYQLGPSLDLLRPPRTLKYLALVLGGRAGRQQNEHLLGILEEEQASIVLLLCTASVAQYAYVIRYYGIAAYQGEVLRYGGVYQGSGERDAATAGPRSGDLRAYVLRRVQY